MDDALKVLVISAAEMPEWSDEIFTFKDTRTGKVLHINATKVRRDIEADPTLAKLETVLISLENFEHIIKNNGVEAEKLLALMGRPDIYKQPVLLADMTEPNDPHPMHTMIDGNHRTVIQCMEGNNAIAGYIIPRSTWERHLVDFPAEMADLLGL